MKKGSRNTKPVCRAATSAQRGRWGFSRRSPRSWRARLRSSHYWIVGVVVTLSAVAVAYDRLTPEAKQPAERVAIEFYNAPEQASQFINYYHAIRLTPEQEEIKNEALTAIPAPCCENYSIATCCCPCNLAKAVWGLSHYLIAERGCTAEEVRGHVEEWIHFTNEDGYSGVACYTNGCNRPFAEDGCGGMDERHIS